MASNEGLYKRSISNDSRFLVAKASLEKDASVYCFLGPEKNIVVQSVSGPTFTIIDETSKSVVNTIKYTGVPILHLEGTKAAPDLMVKYPTSVREAHVHVVSTRDLSVLYDLDSLPFTAVLAAAYPFAGSADQGELVGMGERIDGNDFSLVVAAHATGAVRAKYLLDVRYRYPQSVVYSPDGSKLAALCTRDAKSYIIRIWERR